MSVAVVVAGGSSVWGWGATKISAEAFSEALIESIRKTRVFSSAVSAGPADYSLEVEIKRLDPLGFGATQEAQLVTTWKLRKGGTAGTLWEDLITTIGTVTYWEAPAGLSRLRRSMERAGQKNIQRGIQEISRASLAPQ